MKQLLSTLILLTILTQCVYSQIDAIHSYKTFNSPKTPYIESYLKILTPTFVFKKNKAGGVDYQIAVKQELWQDSTLVETQQYIIKTDDTSTNNVLDHLIDQRRFYVPNNATYNLQISLTDLYSSTNSTKSFSQNIAVNYPQDYPRDSIVFSDVEFLEAYIPTEKETSISKSGFNLYPLVDEFLSDDIIRLAYYFEIYNTSNVLDSNGKYVLQQYIENWDTRKIVSNYNKIKRYTATSIQPVIGSWNIETLPTGNYQLVLQVKNKNNEIIASKEVFFQRLNLRKNVTIKDLTQNNYTGTFADKIPKDSLDEHIKRLLPIAQDIERNTIENQLSTLTEPMKRTFIYQFWSNKNPDDPEKEWRQYNKKIRYVHSQFSTNRLKGYQTDRGKIFLKYGMPNSINAQPSTNNTYPYQVWHYYRAGNFSNKTCIFYLPDAMGEDYILLHSDIPGEAKDMNWKRTLQRRGSTSGELEHQNWFNY